jgi:hypothetical protein
MKTFAIISSFLFLLAHGIQAQTCTQPVITEVKGAGTYCEDEEVTLEVVGSLNNATAWTWYSTSCGGESVGTGTTIKVKVEESARYFVRGTGGCVGTTATCAEVEVKLDDIAPEILTCTENIVVANEPGLCSAVVTFDAPTAEDNCSDEVAIVQIEGPESGSVFPVGTTLIAFEISDELGNKGTCSFTVTVKDEELPVIACPADITADNDPGKCGAVVTYEVPVGTDNCPNAVTVRTAGLGSGAFFPVGTTTETYTVTDASGNTATCSFTVTVKDVEPPVIVMKDKDIEIWPPNHKHHSFSIADQIVSVSDNCGGVTIEDVIIDEVSSDEANNGKGDGNTTDDIVIAEDCRSTQLLAERSGTGNGRVYVVSLALMDLHGNIGTAQFTVKVPHSKGKKSKVVQDDIVYTVNGCDLEYIGPSTAGTTSEGNVEESTEGSTPGERLASTATAVYPNPYNRSFTINFTPSSNDYIKVELYNLMGMKVAELHEQSVEGEKAYQWTFEPPEVTNGTGILIIRGSSTFKTIRLMQQRSY